MSLKRAIKIFKAFKVIAMQEKKESLSFKTKLPSMRKKELDLKPKLKPKDSDLRKK